jgi:hypothetical protein
MGVLVAFVLQSRLSSIATIDNADDPPTPMNELNALARTTLAELEGFQGRGIEVNGLDQSIDDLRGALNGSGDLRKANHRAMNVLQVAYCIASPVFAQAKAKRDVALPRSRKSARQEPTAERGGALR